MSGALFLCVGQLAWYLGRTHAAPTTRSAESRPAKSETKPWGRLRVTELRLEKPSEMLPDITEPMPPTQWHFAGRTREQTVAFLDSCGLTADERNALTAPDTLVVSEKGCRVNPPVETVLSLSRESREALYAELAKSSDNIGHQQPFRIRQALGDTWFAQASLAPDKKHLLQKLTYRRGNALCFADTEIAHRVLNGNECKELVRALYSSDTLLLSLRVEPGDPVETIASYWARGWQKTSVKALLQSLANAGGGEIDVVDLLPPLPRKWLYTYPTAPITAQAEEDCYSSSLNFFRESTEKGFLQPAVRNETFRQNYHTIPKAERFGDIIVFVDSHGATQHACVYVADDIVFTKNGAQNSHPWVFMRLESVRVLYSESDESQTHVFRLRDS